MCHVILVVVLVFVSVTNMKRTGGSDVDPFKGEREGKQREVGSQAVWSLSSCKAGTVTFGIDLVSDNSITPKV